MIARHLATGCLICTSLVLQTSAATELASYQAKPWFPGMALVICVIWHRNLSSICWAGLLGLCVDALSGERLGIHLAISTLIAGLLATALNETRSYGIVLFRTFVIVAAFLWRSLSMLVVSLLSEWPIGWTELINRASRDATYSTVIALMVMCSWNLLFQWTFRREPRSSILIRNQWSMLTR